MRIISSFHDYYDKIQAFGQDQSLVYTREEHDADLDQELGVSTKDKRIRKIGAVEKSCPGVRFETAAFPFPSPYLHTSSGFIRPGELPNRGNFFIIGFAGQVFPCFELKWLYSCFDPSHKLSTNTFCYNLDHVDKAITQNCSLKARDTYCSPPLRSHRRRDFVERREDFDRFFRLWYQKDRATKVQRLFREHPIFVILESHSYQWHVRYNCSLKDYQFQRVKGPAEAYQAISMFLGGLAVPQKQIPIPSDKDMIGIKGFDKYSFRKDKKAKR
jgi:hypothetical protein